MRKSTYTHISSIVCLCFFILIALGSLDENSNSDSTQSSDSENSFHKPDPQMKEKESESYQQKEESLDKLDESKSPENSQAEFESLRSSLLQNLNKCYEFSKRINQSNDEWDTESFIVEGKKYYNYAYQDFLKIQDPKYNLTNSKISIINRALYYYARGFNHIGNFGGPFEKEREDIHKDLENWPYKETESEKNINEGIYKVEIESQSAVAIQLSNKGTWCLWEITNNATIWLDGYVYNNGNGRFSLTNDDLPIYLDTEKNFEIRNPSATKTTVIFKICELEN